jgi:amino acid permease
MPSALSKMGIFLGIFVIAWAGLTAGFGLYLQTRCARYIDRGHVSFAALSQLTYPNASILFDAAIAVKCFGVAVSYLIIIGDLMPGVVVGFVPGAADVSFLVDRQFWITAFMCVPSLSHSTQTRSSRKKWQLLTSPGSSSSLSPSSAASTA